MDLLQSKGFPCFENLLSQLITLMGLPERALQKEEPLFELEEPHPLVMLAQGHLFLWEELANEVTDQVADGVQ